MSTPSVAVIVPTLDSAATLSAALRAVAELDWPREDMDLIVVDGGSVDDTLGLAREHNARLFVRGGTDADFRRNFGAGQTDALTLFFLDPRCAPPRDWVRASLHHMELAQVAAVGVRPLPPSDPDASWVQRAWAQRCLARAADAPARRLDARLLAVRRFEFLAAGGFPEGYGAVAVAELLRRIAGPGSAHRRLVALTRVDGVRLGAGRGLRDFYRAQRRLGEASLSDGLRLGLVAADTAQVLMPLYGLLATFALLASGLRHALAAHPVDLELALVAAAALLPSIGPALRVALRRRRPGLFPGLWLLYVVRMAARGAAVR
jgi:hypothetical protein